MSDELEITQPNKRNNPVNKRPICPICNKECSPSGGYTDGSGYSWTCWDCGYELEDIESLQS